MDLNGCVRVEDYKRFASWLFKRTCPGGDNPKVETDVNLPAPVRSHDLSDGPADRDGCNLSGHYGRDRDLLERYGPQLMAAMRGS